MPYLSKWLFDPLRGIISPSGCCTSTIHWQLAPYWPIKRRDIVGPVWRLEKWSKHIRRWTGVWAFVLLAGSWLTTRWCRQVREASTHWRVWWRDFVLVNDSGFTLTASHNVCATYICVCLHVVCLLILFPWQWTSTTKVICKMINFLR